MSIPIIKSNFLVPSGYVGITLFPFIILRKSRFNELKSKNPNRLEMIINHEKTHWYQQLGLLVIPFYLIYIFNYLFNLFRYGEHDKAYRNIIFEREAYKNEVNPVYKLYRWIKF